MPDRYQALRDAIAAGPTPGARFQGRSPHAYCVYDKQCWCAPDGSRHGETPNLVVTVSPDDAAADAQFIAAADPDTIRALLGERDALREALQIALGDVQRGPVPLTREEKIQIMRAALAAGSQP